MRVVCMPGTSHFAMGRISPSQHLASGTSTKLQAQTTSRSASSRHHSTSRDRLQSTTATDIKSHQLINRDPPAPSLRSPQSTRPSTRNLVYTVSEPPAPKTNKARTILSCRYPPFPPPSFLTCFRSPAALLDFRCLLTISPAIIKIETISFPSFFSCPLFFPHPPIPPVPTPSSIADKNARRSVNMLTRVRALLPTESKVAG